MSREERQAEELTRLRRKLERVGPELRAYKRQCDRLAAENGTSGCDFEELAHALGIEVDG